MMLTDIKLSDIIRELPNACPACGGQTHYDHCPRLKDASRPEYYENWSVFPCNIDPFDRKAAAEWQKAKEEFFKRVDAKRKASK